MCLAQLRNSVVCYRVLLYAIASFLACVPCFADDALAEMSDGASVNVDGKRKEVVVVPHNAIRDDQRVTPDTIPDVALAGKAVNVRLCTNEYEPASIVIWSWKPLKNLIVEVSDLQSAIGDRLSADCMDVRWVKCWYQGSSYAVKHTGKEMVPELLLKNPDMVKVDYKSQTNVDPLGSFPAREHPDDAATLLPIKYLAAKNAQQAWLTIKVPSDTRPGVYSGRIIVRASNISPVIIPLKVDVLSFRLHPSPITHGFYTNSHWGDRRIQSRARGMAEIRNLVEHGATTVGVYERTQDLGEVIAMMREGGLQADPLYKQWGGDTHTWTGMDEEKAYKIAKPAVDEARKHGVKDVYIYLPDEAKGKRLKKSIPIAKGIHRADGKTWTAGYGDYFNIAGKYIDLIVMAHGPAPKSLVDKIHGVGSRIFCYHFPQGGVEQPEEYRRNYGILLWAADYDGGMTWAWWWAFGPKKGISDPWNDFDSTHWRDHNMVYPTKSGVVDTIQWEGWREGVDDCRYLATLLKSIADAKKQGRTQQANAAEEWVNKLKKDRSMLTDLDALRDEIIRHIEQCQGARISDKKHKQ